MATRKLIRAIQKLPRRTRKLSARLTKDFFTWLLRSLYTIWRRPTASTAGFVLPTTVLLLLMVALTAGALTYRSFSRSEQAIAKREQQVITNSATPAIDRARAKIEYLFRQDDRFPGGVPASDFLIAMLLDEDVYNVGVPELSTGAGPTGASNPYTLPDETQLDINNDGTFDPAWVFKSDINGDGTIANTELVVYSILTDDIAPIPGTTPADPSDPSDPNVMQVSDTPDIDKARALVTRTGPLNTTETNNACPGSTRSPGGGWQLVNTADNSVLEKNFQVNAFVLNQNDVNRTVETLEFQQGREAAQGNRWGAWFRYDMETFPGAALNWNGAMHTEGNFFAADQFNAHLVSSHNSCVYDRSEITVGLKAAGDNNGGGAFQGELISGRVSRDDFSNGNGQTGANFHIYSNDNDPPGTTNGLNSSNDTVDGATVPSEIATNPIKLFTESVYEHNANTWNSVDSGTFSPRIFPEPSNARLDDTYRADGRWGPISVYDTDGGTVELPSGKLIGTPIEGSDAGATTLEANNADGYWERRAIALGLRLIVGQRFDFGNAFGWRSAEDPLYPPTSYDSGSDSHYRAPGATGTFYPGYNEMLQNRSLRDNLAAVQGMVVYHYEGGGGAIDGETPLACYALTAHPGTRYTIGNSRTFDTYGIVPSAGSRLKVDFLSGVGTNGWEFNFPAALPGALDTALQNLADLAGDPLGGAPSFPAYNPAFNNPAFPLVTQTAIHPDPYLTTWGDFSMLKRVRNLSGTLSPADRSTIDSAACTLGLMAYNIDTLNKVADGAIDGTATTPYSLTNLADAITDAVSAGVPADLANYTLEQWFNRTGGQNVTDPNGPLAELFYGATPGNPSLNTSDDNPDARELFVALSQKFQVERDRRYGFDTARALPSAGTAGTPSAGDPVYDEVAKTYTTSDSIETSPAHTTNPYTNSTLYPVSCDPAEFASIGDEARQLSLAIAVCPPVAPATPYSSSAVARYPALYYVFPLADHDLSTDQPSEPYIDNSPATAATNDPSGVGYQAITDSDIADIADDFLPKDNVGWALPDPLSLGTGDLLLSEIETNGTGAYDPNDVSATNNAGDYQSSFNTGNPGDSDVYFNYDPEAEDITVAHDGNLYEVAWVDKGMFDGRENMGVRVLDLDLARLTQNTNPGGSDFWITATGDGAQGIVYAFREDAVREDAIVRPRDTLFADADAAWTACNSIATIDDANCAMSALVDGDIQDPPINPATGISAKPVDFYADPMRRPHGFRLKNGQDLSAPLGGTLRRDVGMTFITDNSVYIQGNLNLHSTNGLVGGRIEEFTQLITDAPINYGELTYDQDEFYDARDSSELNNGTFAVLDQDHWRPTEILADSINILSDRFKDGSIDDGFRMESLQGTTNAVRGSGQSSYMNQNRPFYTEGFAINDEWTRENPLDNKAYISHGGNPGSEIHLPIMSPVTVPANGDYWDSFSGGNDVRLSYYRFVNNHTNASNPVKPMRYSNLMTPETTYINAILISGIVPSRGKQSYGGLHNFPRLSEDWGGGRAANRKDLFISGAFWQFNFSTAATGPYDHDAWEVDSPPDSDENNLNYTAPERLWGYDVGLLYVPPAPISARFVNAGAARSEYYRELPVDDPYILMLRCAEYDPNTPGARVDPTANNDNTCVNSNL